MYVHWLCMFTGYVCSLVMYVVESEAEAGGRGCSQLCKSDTTAGSGFVGLLVIAFEWRKVELS